MSSHKRLIEVTLPLAEIGVQSAREKSIRHGHISTLHIWWARRPLAAMRAAIFASLITDPGDDEKRKKLPEKRLVQHGAVEVEEWVIPWRRMCANEANGC